MESYIYKIVFIDSEDREDGIFEVAFFDDGIIEESEFFGNKRGDKKPYITLDAWYHSFYHPEEGKEDIYESIDILLEEDLLLEFL